MASGILDLTDRGNGEALEQGSAFGIIMHFTQPEHWQVTITSVGTIPNTFTISVNDVAYSYTTEAGDTPALVIEGLALAMCKACDIDVDTSGDTLELSGVSGDILDTALTLGTGGAGTLIQTQARYADLTGAILTAAVLPTGAAEVDWGTKLNVLSASEGRVQLILLESDTILYTWTTGNWELYADYGGGNKQKLVRGSVQVIPKVTGA